MKLSEIFESEELSDGEKVTAIAEVVTKAREAYGNGDTEITVPEIHTIDGLENLNMLSDESKVIMAESEVRNIKVVANEFCKAFEGAVLDRKVAELIAISPLLTNITVKSESEFI